MGLLMPLGAVLVAVGLAGSASACYQSESYTKEGATSQTDTRKHGDPPKGLV